MADEDLRELEEGAPRDEGEQLDEENRLKEEFVDSVVAALEQRNEGRAYELVEPLHPADIADLLELLEPHQRHRLAAAITDLLTASVSAAIIYFFGGAIEQLVALAALSPVVASIGGNAGTQTMAVTVRAIATNQLTRSNTRRILWREMRVALLNGATIALLIGLATALIFSALLGPLLAAKLGLVIGAAMVINIVTAGFAGVAIPVMLDRMDQDPAVASSVFVTMITDSMGYFVFLALAVAAGLVG